MNFVLQAFPKWMKSNDGSLSEDTVFKSWSEEDKSTAWFDFLKIVLNIVKVLLQTGMFVSAAVGGFLDNTIPGELCVIFLTITSLVSLPMHESEMRL